MFCSRCGNQIADTEIFCRFCGNRVQMPAQVQQPATPEPQPVAPAPQPVTPAPEVKKIEKPKGKFSIVQFVAGIACGALVISLIAAVLFVSGALGGGRIEGNGFSSPEKAAVAYLEAMKKGDVEKMSATFAVETYVDNYQLDAYIDRMHAFIPSSQLQLQAVDTYTREMMINSRMTGINRDMVYQYIWLAAENPEQFCEGKVISVTDSADAPYCNGADLVEDLVDPEWKKTISKLEIGKVYDQEWVLDELMGDVPEQYEKQRIEMYDNIVGCDESACVAVEFSLDGEEYFLFMTVIRYGNRWYNCQCSGLLGNYVGLSSMQGGICKVEDFEEW